MREQERYTDPMVLAVVFNDYETVKSLLETGKYDKNVFKDIGSNYSFSISLPIQYISRCWEICLGHDFKESFNAIAKKNYENAKKILALFKNKFGINDIEIPFSELSPVCWDSEEGILGGERSEFLFKGVREVDLDLFIAVCRMDLKRAKELLEQGASPFYRHYGEGDFDLLDMCLSECSYQATCQAGDIIKDSAWFRTAINEEEIASIIWWAANEMMYNLLEKYSTTAR